MASRQNPSEHRLAAERNYFKTSTKRLYVKQSPWSKRRQKLFEITIGVIYSADGEIKVRDIEFPSSIIAKYTDLDAMLADWVKL